MAKHLMILSLSLILFGQAQEKSRRQDPQEDTIRIDTSLVTIPVIVSDRNDVYIPDMRQEEFEIFEDGVRQEIAFFAATKEPFHVVLMIDTSASTQEKLGPIQQAAKAFVAQLQPADRVKVIQFDDRVDDLCGFTSDRAELDRVIESTRSGEGTKLYDAVTMALNHLRRIKGRKAIVLFTDGVDWHSDYSRFEQNTGAVEESEVIVYPIRYDTRPETEEMLRNQRETIGETDLGIIFGGPNNRLPRGSTPPTVPGSGGPPVSTGRTSDPYRLPIPSINLPFPRDRNPDGTPRGRYPDDRFPDDRYPGRTRLPGDPRMPDDDRTGGGGFPSPSPRSRRDSSDSIGTMLDGLYRTGDQYLQEMASKSGGRLHRADTLRDLPAAFARIADELRSQYSIGYYPSSQRKDGKFHKIQIKTTRRNAVVRSKPGYRAAQ
ncbi:MAG: VWA domain-containing protein [Acidobacteriota bacterium]|nr:MAG: VWA domain-containing protein [Acidobacteriota bacterium]